MIRLFIICLCVTPFLHLHAQEDKLPVIAILSGTVSEFGGTPISEARVKLRRSDGQEFEIRTNTEGKYRFGADTFQIGRDYLIYVWHPKRNGLYKGCESTRNLEVSTHFVSDFELPQPGCAAPFPLITWESPISENNDTLNELLTVLNHNPNIVIELNGLHTRVSDSLIMLERVATIQVYLLAQGIDSGRVKVKHSSLDRTLLKESYSRFYKAGDRCIETQVLRDDFGVLEEKECDYYEEESERNSKTNGNGKGP